MLLLNRVLTCTEIIVPTLLLRQQIATTSSSSSTKSKTNKRGMRYSSSTATVAVSAIRKIWTRCCTTTKIGCTTSLLLLHLPSSSAFCFRFHHQHTHLSRYHNHRRHYHLYHPSLLIHNEMMSTTMTTTTTPSTNSKLKLCLISLSSSSTTTRLLSTSNNDDNEISKSSSTNSSIIQLQQQLATTVSSTNTININWNDRKQLQNLWNNIEKGWMNVPQVIWKESKYGGIGLFSSQKDIIPKGTILRYGIIGKNLVQFHNIHDIEQFLQQATNNNSQGQDKDSSSDDGDTYNSRLMYVKDYLWGLNLYTDERGYSKEETKTDDDGANEDSDDDVRDRFFGMW